MSRHRPPAAPHYVVPANGDWSKAIFKERAQNVHVHFSGISESRNLLEEGLPLWKCAGDLRYTIDHSTKRDRCQQNDEWAKRHNVTFLGACRESLGVMVAGYCDPLRSTSFSWAWKHTLPASSNDRRAAELIREQRKQGKRAIAVFSALPIHSWSEPGAAGEGLLDSRTEMSDAWAPPHSALGHWLAGVEQFFHFLKSELQPHACVVWKGNNVGSRSYASNRTTRDGEVAHQQHHASSQGGVNDWMNRVAFALASRYGIATLDMTRLTVAQTESAAWSSRWGDDLAAGKVDLHHWYSGLWRPVMTGLLKLCSDHYGGGWEDYPLVDRDDGARPRASGKSVRESVEFARAQSQFRRSEVRKP